MPYITCLILGMEIIILPLRFQFYTSFSRVTPIISEGGRLEARLTGFRGGEGILELAQRKGQNPKLLAIMTGLQENRVSMEM